MPKEEVFDTAPQDEIADPERDNKKDKPAKSGGCGFRNLHWTGEGKIVCTLAKGHPGDHQGFYPDTEKVTYFSDAAGIELFQGVQDKLDVRDKEAAEKKALLAARVS